MLMALTIRKNPVEGQNNVPVERKEVLFSIVAPADRLSETEANLRKILAKATADDIAGIARLMDNPIKLALARKNM